MMMQTYPLTIGQKNILAMQRFYPNSGIGNQCRAMIFAERHDMDRLEKAWHRTVKIHDALRLRMTQADRQVFSNTIEQVERLHFPDRRAMDDFCTELASCPLDAVNAPQYRFYLFEIDGRQGCVLCVNHMIADAWTCSLAAQTLVQQYEALTKDPDAPVPSAPSYLDMIQADEQYLASTRFQQDRAFWEALYPSAPYLARINAAPRSGAPEARALEHTLTAIAEAALKTLCAAWKTTPAVIFETVMLMYLARLHPDAPDVTLAIPTHNRAGVREKETAGMRVATIPITLPVQKDVSAKAWARALVARKTSIFRHQKYPLSLIREHLRNVSAASGNLYDVMVNYHIAETVQGQETRIYHCDRSEVALCLHIDDRDHAGRHMLTFYYQTAVFPEEQEVSLLADRIESMIRQLAECPEMAFSELEIVSPREARLLDSFNRTEEPFSSEQCVHDLFKQAVKREPARDAILFRQERLSYETLDHHSEALAAWLRSHGVGPGMVVPIIAHRGWRMIAGMLGVLQAGGAFMLVDPGYPVLRIRQMMEQVNCGIVLTDGLSEPFGKNCLDLGAFDFERPVAYRKARSKPADLCYVVFTSGSTGQPKGIGVTHRNVINYVIPNAHNVLGRCIPTDARSIVCTTNPVFDIFITETLLPLLNGMTVIMADDGEAALPSSFAALMSRHKAQVLQTTPTRMRLLLSDSSASEALRPLHTILMGGEAFPPELFQALREKCDARIWNVYGPAETTVWSSAVEITDGTISIGSPVANTQMYVLDDEDRLMPIGAQGELCIAGEGVSAGYLNRPDLTEERFLPAITGETRMYRTGDLACWRADGTLLFLGRRDTQVKLRGQRIELGEIESAMACFPGIKLAATALQASKHRELLCGYYCSATPIDEAALREYLKQRLPAYMVPQAYMRLPEMPMTPSGKLDRRKLPEIQNRRAEPADAPPETPTEKRLEEIWKQELMTEQISREDDFFLLGGDSLTAIMIIQRIQEQFRIPVDVADFLSHPCLKELAAWVDEQEENKAEWNHAPITDTGTDRYVLLPQQMAHYRHYQRNPSALTYQIGYRVPLPPDVDRDRLEAAIRAVVRMEKGLNCRIETAGDQSVAVYDPGAELSIWLGTDEKAFRRPFDLGQAPLIHIGFTPDSLLMDLHHIATDAASIDILFQRIADAYVKYDAARPKLWFGDYAALYHQLDFSEAFRFYQESLAGNLHPMRKPGEETRVIRGETRHYAVPDELFRQVQEAGRAHHITSTGLALAAYVLTLAGLLGEREIVTMMSFQNRARAEAADMIGMFSTSQPVHISVTGSKDAFLAHVMERLRAHYRYQEVPQDRIIEQTGEALRSVATAFVFLQEAEPIFPDGFPMPEPMDTGEAVMELSLRVNHGTNSGEIALDYDLDKYSKEEINSFSVQYFHALRLLCREVEPGERDILELFRAIVGTVEE